MLGAAPNNPAVREVDVPEIEFREHGFGLRVAQHLHARRSEGRGARDLVVDVEEVGAGRVVVDWHEGVWEGVVVVEGHLGHDGWAGSVRLA